MRRTYRALIPLGIVLLAAVVVSSAFSKFGQKSLKDQIDRLPDPGYQIADYNRHITQINDLITRYGDKDPDAAYAYYQLGLALDTAQRGQDAISAYDKSMSLSQKYHGASDSFYNDEFARKFLDLLNLNRPEEASMMMTDVHFDVKSQCLATGSLYDWQTNVSDRINYQTLLRKMSAGNIWRKRFADGEQLLLIGYIVENGPRCFAYSPDGQYFGQFEAKSQADFQSGLPLEPTSLYKVSVSFIVKPVHSSEQPIYFAAGVYPGRKSASVQSLTFSQGPPIVFGRQITDENDASELNYGFRYVTLNLSSLPMSYTLDFGMAHAPKTTLSLPPPPVGKLPSHPSSYYEWATFTGIHTPANTAYLPSSTDKAAATH